MHFLFPCHPLDRKNADDLFVDQFKALEREGFAVALLSDDPLGSSTRIRGIPSDSVVIYRGWMLNAGEYRHLQDAVERCGSRLLTSLDAYLNTHHLPNWYPLISDLTPETVIFDVDTDLEFALESLGWESFFIKDYVKSLKTSIGSFISRPSQINQVVAEMKSFRGEIEGGVCVRRVEPFLAETERRYFVVEGKPHAAEKNAEIPEIVRETATRIQSRFFSVDVVERSDGKFRVVEIGDGQVSDLVGWTAPAFAKVWKSLVECDHHDEEKRDV